MRVLHVLALVTPDGAYGGPARVAVNACRSLTERGHRTSLWAGTRGYTTVPTSLDHVSARLFAAHRVLPVLGYAAITAPGLLRALRQRTTAFDIVHVHLSRDLVTLPAAVLLRRRRIPYVVQTHGMVVPHRHPLARLIDRFWTVPVLRSARAVLYLDDAERAALEKVAGTGMELRELSNGMPRVSDVATLPASPPEVLFLARLHPRKRPEVFALAALQLLRAGVEAQFVIAGPPEGAENLVDAVIDRARKEGYGDDRLRREGAIPFETVTERMRRASIYVLTADREPFGMTILEALAVGVPVVIGGDGGLASFVTQHHCGVVVNGGATEFAAGIGELLSDPGRRHRLSRTGRAAVEQVFGMEAVAARLEAVYESAMCLEAA